MGFRFRRSLRIAPGIKFNVGIKSVSASFGTRGLWYTIGTAGRRFTTGLPGTGFYWTTTTPPAPRPFVRVIVVAAGLVLLGLAAATLLSR